MDTDWWPAEARLLYSHGLSQPQNQQQPQQQEPHERRHRETRAAARGAWRGSRTRSSSLATVAPPRSHAHPLQAPPPPHGCLLVRTFATASHDVVSLGDTLTPRASLQEKQNDSQRRHHVFTGGTPGSGRTALVRQFFSSDYTHGYEDAAASAAAAATAVELEVVVDDWHVRLLFEDPAEETAARRWNELGAERGVLHAFLVVYSVVDEESFKEARELLRRLEETGATRNHVVILVANKTDLVRARQVSTSDGRQTAQEHSCKFIECSGGMNHRVDELLAGVASQLRVHSDAEHHQHQHQSKHGFFNRLLHRHSRSCQDLFK